MLTADFSIETIEDKRRWNEMLKEIALKNEDELENVRQEKSNRTYHQQNLYQKKY